jgi:multiple antibiotic resistance protein
VIHTLDVLAIAVVPTLVDLDSRAGVDLSPQNIFTMLFLMLGPFKILLPFVSLTKDLERNAQIRLATIAIGVAAIILGIAGFLGRRILDNFGISVPVIALTGGVILFLTALQLVLHSTVVSDKAYARSADQMSGVAVDPLAFPIIVTPYGLAAVIAFTTLAQDNSSLTMTIGLAIAAILAVDWLAMIFAQAILKWLGTALKIVAVVLGVVQVALGLQIIVRSLFTLGFIGST